MSKKIDMTEWVMKEHGVPESRWTVIKEDPQSLPKCHKWICRCECGTIKSIRGTELRNGNSKSCGCISRELKRIDMTGWKMWEHGVPDSHIIVLNEFHNEDYPNQIFWNCLCTLCGKSFIDNGKGIKTGNKKSCGCLNAKATIERNSKKGCQIKEGYKFSSLTVLKDLGFRKQESRDKNWRWSLCQCDCGSAPIEVPNALLISGHKKSCGCLKSYGENIIIKILKENNITFQTEFKFPDLYNKDPNKPLRFDFAIFNNDSNDLLFLIEFDGRQHFTGPEAKWKNSNTLEEIKFKDNLKNEYCKKHNILLKRIPYFKINKISYDTIFGNEFNIN